MFGVPGDGCPRAFRVARTEEFEEAAAILRARDPLCSVPEQHLLGQGQCRVAVSRDESSPSVLIEPTAPKITLGVHGRATAPSVRSFLAEVEPGVGFVASPELEPLIMGTPRVPSVIRMDVLSASRVRPDAGGEPKGNRQVLSPEHEAALAEFDADGLGFLECYDSVSGFLSLAITGAASIVDDVIVSICVVYAHAVGAYELGVYTRPEYRGHGHATAAASTCIDRVVAPRGRPVWTAVDEVSRGLGVKLGLRPVGEKLYVMFQESAA